MILVTKIAIKDIPKFLKVKGTIFVLQIKRRSLGTDLFSILIVSFKTLSKLLYLDCTRKRILAVLSMTRGIGYLTSLDDSTYRGPDEQSTRSRPVDKR